MNTVSTFAASFVVNRAKGHAALKQTAKSLRTEDIIILVLAAFILTACPVQSFAQAYGQDILSAGVNIYTWMRRAGLVLTLIGLGWGGLKITVQHDTQHLKGPLFTLLGGLICLAAPSIVNLMASIAPNASVAP